MQPTERIRRDGLLAAAVLFLTANLVHSADHLRQHMAGVNSAVMTGGALITLAAVVTVVLAVRRDPRASLVATIVGFAAAVLVAGAHLAPHWSVLSDSYVDDIHPDGLSWAVVVLEVVTGFVLGVVGSWRLARSGGGAPATMVR